MTAEFAFSQLTPTAFLERSSRVRPDAIAVVDGASSFTYAELADRSRRLAGALAGFGVEPGDRVAALCSNSHVMIELHHGVPWCGGVLVTLNVRLSVDELVHILGHSGSRVLIATVEFEILAGEIATRCPEIRVVVAGGERDEYEGAIAAAPRLQLACEDERGLLALNYTSGTTGQPKGVMYHHRGAHLQALSMAFHTSLGSGSRYLWTLPMFHCNGWCFPWSVCAAGATHVCLRGIDAEEIWRLIREEGVTHFSAAPTVLTMIAESPSAAPAERPIHVDTGGAPPSPALLGRLAGLGMDVTHLYGLTETFGPVCINDWHPEWNTRSPQERARLAARQGVPNVIADRIRVIDSADEDVPEDASTVGEIVVRGNDLMLGYYRDPEATAAVTTPDGWFRTGDMAVVHPDGYLEIRDRMKDIIISGGENISSVEVERVLDSHPDVIESAVVAAPDDRWGEVPVAYVTLRAGANATESDLAAHVRTHLARFKAPKRIEFGELPKTSTGKIRKNVLRGNDPATPVKGTR